MWLIISYVVSFMVIWGIYDVIRLLNNLYKGNIFTYENADILKIIDKKIIFTIIFDLISNTIRENKERKEHSNISEIIDKKKRGS